MKYLNLVIFAVFAIATCSCRSTKFPATNAEKRSYHNQEDREYNPPREKDYDKESGKGGGVK